MNKQNQVESYVTLYEERLYKKTLKRCDSGVFPESMVKEVKKTIEKEKRIVRQILTAAIKSETDRVLNEVMNKLPEEARIASYIITATADEQEDWNDGFNDCLDRVKTIIKSLL